MDKQRKYKMIKRFVIIFSIVVIAMIVGSIIIKYQVEGETNMPFRISKIMVISNAQGIQNEDSEHKWDLQLVQNNDIYIDISKNKNYYQTEIIDKILLDNFMIEEQPIKGNVKLYKPNQQENGIYVNSDEYLIQHRLEYVGSEKSNIKNLEIANQGGMILLRYVNEELGQYTSSQEEEIRHDGTLLSRIGILDEDITFKVSFDISIILTSEKTYKANIELKLPVGNVVQEGTSSYEKTDVRDIVFKRE